MTRKERERAEAELKRRWRVASAIRSGWTAQDRDDEQEALAVQIAQLLAAGMVTTLPVGYAKGSVGQGLFD